MAERRESTKKVAENLKMGKNSAENRKRKVSRKPENLKIFAENGKLFFKAAETGNHF